MTALLLVLILAAIAAGVGARLLRGLRLADEPLSDRFVFATALGLGCVAYAIFALGALQLFRPVPMLLLLAGLLAWAAAPALALVREAWAGLRAGCSSRSILSLALGAAVALLMGLALVAALAPPAGNDWDGLSYHLADPAIYLRRGGIVPLFWESHSNFPFTVEMLYTVALLAKSAGAARAIHWLYLVLACLTLASAWRRIWPEAAPGARWLAPLILCSSPIVLWSATVAYIDLALMAYELLALYGVVLWWKTGRTGWLWAGAIALGFALGTKMTGLLFLALLAPLVLAAGLRAKESWGGALRRVVAWGAIAVAIGAPWYVKSYLYTGNPVYPFFYHLFPNTRYWNADLAAIYAKHQDDDFGLGDTLAHLVSVPWDLLAHPDSFTDGAPAFRILFGSLGPAFLALAPIALFLRRRDPLAFGSLLFAAAYGVLWFHMTQQTRHLLPVAPLLALAAARGLSALVDERRFARFPGFGAAGVQAAHALLIGVLMAGPAWPVVTGRVPAHDYLRSTLDIYPICEYANECLPEDARLLLIHEVRGFYLERDYLWGNEGHHAAIPWSGFRDEVEMRRYLRQELGVTHVLVNHRIQPREARPEGWERTLWEAIRAGTLEPVMEERGYCVYAVQPQE